MVLVLFFTILESRCIRRTTTKQCAFIPAQQFVHIHLKFTNISLYILVFAGTFSNTIHDVRERRITPTMTGSHSASHSLAGTPISSSVGLLGSPACTVPAHPFNYQSERYSSGRLKRQATKSSENEDSDGSEKTSKSHQNNNNAKAPVEFHLGESR